MRGADQHGGSVNTFHVPFLLLSSPSRPRISSNSTSDLSSYRGLTMPTTQTAPPLLLLTDLPAETLSSIFLLLLPVDALHLSLTARTLRDLTRATECSLLRLFVESYTKPVSGQIADEEASPGDEAFPGPVGAFIDKVADTTCHPDLGWHPEAAKRYELEDVAVCEACSDERIYANSELEDMDPEGRINNLVRALHREGIEWRDDSRLCADFVECGGRLPSIVQTM